MKPLVRIIFLCCLFGPNSKAEDLLEKKIKEVIVKSPEILMDAQKNLMEKMSQEFDDQQNEKIQTVLRQFPDLLKQMITPVLGSGNKKVFAFLSPYCKHCQAIMRDFFDLTTDPRFQVSLVWSTHKEDKGGLIAARALLAAYELGKLKEFFESMSEKVNMLEKKDALEMAQNIGLDPIIFQEKMESKAIGDQLKTMRTLTEKLSLSGFPTLIYEKENMPGQYAIIEGRPQDGNLKQELLK